MRKTILDVGRHCPTSWGPSEIKWKASCPPSAKLTSGLTHQKSEFSSLELLGLHERSLLSQLYSTASLFLGCLVLDWARLPARYSQFSTYGEPFGTA